MGLKKSLFNVKTALAGIGFGLLAKNLVQTGKSIESLQVRLKFLFGSAEEGSKAFDNMAKFSKNNNIKILQQVSNEKDKVEIMKTYDSLKINYELFSFDENLYKKMQDVDLAITRCGASTLSDLVYYNIPFIGIPFPHAKDNHQYYFCLRLLFFDC